MKDPLDTFLHQVRQKPSFVEAAQADQKWLEHFNDME
jgi:hypothetical protein